MGNNVSNKRSGKEEELLGQHQGVEGTMSTTTKIPQGTLQFTLPSNEPGGKAPTGARPPCIQLTKEQKKLIQESWKSLEQDIAQVGIIVFINLFESHPDMQSAFLPFTGFVLEDLKKSKLLREHAMRVMGAVQRSVGRLHEPEKLDPYLRELGRRHNKNGAKIEYIDYIGPQFLSAIRPSLAAEWCPELEQAWTSLMSQITHAIKDSMMEARLQEIAAAEAAAAAALAASADVPT